MTVGTAHFRYQWNNCRGVDRRGESDMKMLTSESEGRATCEEAFRRSMALTTIHLPHRSTLRNNRLVSLCFYLFICNGILYRCAVWPLLTVFSENNHEVTNTQCLMNIIAQEQICHLWVNHLSLAFHHGVLGCMTHFKLRLFATEFSVLVN
jgi:hypothetical protein